MSFLPSVFYAQCNAVDVPYIENFGQTAAGTIPACTSTQQITPHVWKVSSAGVLTISNNYETANSWFYTQGVNLEAGKTYTLALDYKRTASPQSFKVAYGTSPVDTSMTNMIQTFSSVTNSSAMPVSFAITPSATGVYYFGFNLTTEYVGMFAGVLLIDNIAVSQSTLSTLEVQPSKILGIYPNPVKNHLYIKGSGKKTEAEIMNEAGQKVLSVNGVLSEIDISGLVKGVYFLVMKNEAGIRFSEKFIKE